MTQTELQRYTHAQLQAFTHLRLGASDLITDRTQEDVDHVADLMRRIRDLGWDNLTPVEQDEWLSPLKGAYNASDLNRVSAAVETISAIMEDYGYSVAIHPKQDWDMQDIPTAAALALYLRQARELVQGFVRLPTTPPLPATMDHLDYQGANAIEQNLMDLHLLLYYMADDFRYEGQAIMGVDF